MKMTINKKMMKELLNDYEDAMAEVANSKITGNKIAGLMSQGKADYIESLVKDSFHDDYYMGWDDFKQQTIKASREVAMLMN